MCAACICLAPTPALSGSTVAVHPDGAASLAAADLNGDGRTDLVVATSTANTITIFLQQRDGGFPKKPNAVVATGVQQPKEPIVRRQVVVAGDLNADGKTDLVITNSTAGVASILLGRGDGSFLDPITLGTLPLPVGVAVGDFNGDAKADLAIVSQGANKVSLWYGNGDGHFLAGRDVEAGQGPTTLVAGDFGTSETEPTRDRKLDLAVLAAGEGKIAILFGDGAGGFSPPVKFEGVGATAITAADFNGDGVLDLATANTTANFVGITLGFGKGTLGCFGGQNVEAEFAPSVRPTGLAAVDLNHDGNPDLAVAVESPDPGGSGVVILLNHPRPRMRVVYFDPPVFCLTGGIPAATVAGEFSGATDALDVAVVDRNVDHVSLLFGDGKGGFANCQAPQAVGEPLGTTRPVRSARTAASVPTLHD